MSRKLTPHLEGAVLLQLRRKAKWTQRRLEREAGLSRGTLSLYETGKRKLARPLLNRLALTLGHSVDAVDHALAGLAQIPALEISGAETPASLTSAEWSVVEAAAGQAARRAVEAVRAGLGLRVVRERLRRERQTAGKLWEQLCRLPTHQARRDRIASDPRFRLWALCERLCDESIDAAAHDAGQAKELAELAVQVAELEPGSDAWRCRLQGYAWALVGNAQRVGSKLSDAEQAFLRSDEFLEAGKAASPSPLDESLPLSCKATLRCQQGEFLTALELHNQALTVAPSEIERARIFLSRSITLMCLDRFEEALASLALAARWIETKGKPRWRCSLRFRRILNLCHMGLFDKALLELGELRSIALELGLALDELRLVWLESRVFSGLGRYAEAVEGFSRVWHEFTSRGITFDAVVAILELCELELSRGNFGEVKTLSQAAASILDTRKIPDRLLERFYMFREAVERQAATAVVAHGLVREFERVGARVGSAR